MHPLKAWQQQCGSVTDAMSGKEKTRTITKFTFSLPYVEQ